MPKKTDQNKWYSVVTNMADRTAEIYIDGVIGWDVTSASLIADVNQHKNLTNIHVYINTLGGGIGEGLAILNFLRRHSAHVTTEVTGYALSMGSIILLAGDQRLAASNTLMMIHRAQGGAYGDAKDMAKEAKILEKHEQVLIGEYVRVMGAPEEEIQEMLNEETWFTAEEALEAGLISEIVEPIDMDESENRISTQQWQAVAKAGYKHAPKDFSTRMTANLHLPTNGGLTMPKPEEAKPAAAAASPENKPTDTSVSNTVDVQAIARAAVKKENERQTGIRAAFATADKYLDDDAPAMLEKCLGDMDCDKAAANQVILDAMGKQAPAPVGSHAIVIADEKDRFAAGVALALSSRAGTLSANDKAKDRANNFRGYTLLELARAALTMNGVNTGNMSKMQLVGNAFTHTSGDFSSLLANVAEKSMLKGYDEAEETFQLWTARGEASDFKAIKRVDLNSFPSLSKVAEGAEYNYGTIGDRGETIQLATYGKMFSITRQAIINDDLSAFTRIPQKMGRAAIRTVGDLVYAILTSNPAMSDGTALFHANHKNLLTAAAIATAAIDNMRVKMATQKDAGDNAHALNIRLAQLIVPMALQGTANVVRDSEFDVSGNNDKTIPNSVRGTFDVIADARLDASSAISWYGSANSGMHDTIEVSYLDGQDTPYLESKDGWNVDGVEMKVRIDAAVSPLDFRTMAKNPGV